MGWYDNIQEAHREAQQMERCSIIADVEKTKILAEAQAKANAIEERISKLLALPNHG